MKVVALTGGIGSGKSSVLREFERLGAEVMDADKISHNIMKRGKAAYNETVAKFGGEILDSNGEIDRKKLAKIVFCDKDKLKLLNGITHRLIYKEISDRISASDAKVVCVEIPLLFSSPSPLDIDVKIVVTADKEKRIARAIKRDGATREQIEARMARQFNDDEMIKLADIVIENDGDIKALRSRVGGIYEELTNGGAERRPE